MSNAEGMTKSDLGRRSRKQPSSYPLTEGEARVRQHGREERFSSFEPLGRHSSFVLRHFGSERQLPPSKLRCHGTSNCSARARSAAMASIVARGAINDGSIFNYFAA